MNKKIHLVSYAHIDPVWQWEWEEGAAEAISTYRTAAKLCEEFDGYIFCHNEAQLYMWVKEYEPELFDKIKELVKIGKWHIKGGWYLQPDCNMPSGEAFVRQALFGRNYFKTHFGKVPTTAINFDSFGHTRGLVQILAKSGYDSYLHWRPDDSVNCHLPAEAYTWVGYDASKVTGQRILSSYGSKLGKAAEKVRWVLSETADGESNICVWGVGNHGGGPSFKDLEDITQLIKEAKENGDEIIHSTPEAYFSDIRPGGFDPKPLPEHHGDLNPRFPGCYTSQARVKRMYRLLENSLFFTEKICSHAALLAQEAGTSYPKEKLRESELDLLTAQFHDTLPGTSVEPVELNALRSMSHGLEILSRLRAKAFFRLADGLKKPMADEIPIIAYNPHPYPVDGIFCCEFSLWDSCLDEGVFFNPTVYDNGKALPTQAEKELSNLPIEWRKRVAFKTTLAPAAISYFTCQLEQISAKPAFGLMEKNGNFAFENDCFKITINKRTGLVDRFLAKGENPVDILAENAFRIAVFDDHEDPWCFDRFAWMDIIGSFELLSPEESRLFSGLKKADSLPSPVRVIEDGDVRTVVEAIFGYNRSRAVVRYLLPKSGPAFDVEIRIQNTEKKKMFKLILPAAFDESIYEGETAFGREVLPMTGRENVSQRYLMLYNDEIGFSIANDGVYASSCVTASLSEEVLAPLSVGKGKYKGPCLMPTLLRSPAYTAHPIEDREIMPQDRFSPYTDQGEIIHSFRLRVLKDKDNRLKEAHHDAVLLNQPPFLLSFYPHGASHGKKPGSLVLLPADVEMTAFKMAEDGNGFIIRVFNPADKPVKRDLEVPLLKVKATLSLGAFAAETYRITEGRCVLTDMVEGIAGQARNDEAGGRSDCGSSPQ
ncbi:MAG: alpha-mannosidase [Lachnospiraceae bacterium]|nr:alpha-mannosidase [Lachnospiraceae bacterium]